MKHSLPAALLAFLAPATLALAPAVAQPAAKPPVKAAKACGVTALPLSLGNEWVYERSSPPPDRVLSEAQLRMTPVQPSKLTIKVTAVDVKPEGTTVTLSEDLDGKVHTTTIRCTAGGATFAIAPDAFWFAGEAGTTFGVELTNVERKGQTLSLALGKLTGLEWHDDVQAAWKHVATGKAQPKTRKGTLDLKRHWVVLPEEKLISKTGVEQKAAKLGLETTVNVTIDPAPEQPLKAPPLLVNFFWFVDGVGPIQVLNSYSQMFVLTSSVIN